MQICSVCEKRRFLLIVSPNSVNNFLPWRIEVDENWPKTEQKQLGLLGHHVSEQQQQIGFPLDILHHHLRKLIASPLTADELRHAANSSSGDLGYCGLCDIPSRLSDHSRPPTCWYVVMCWQCTIDLHCTKSAPAKAIELKCQDPPHYPGCGILGIKHLRYILDADKKRLFPNMMVDRQQLMSKLHGRECSTFSFEILGQRIVFTSDPKNIQAMLATQFSDFDLGQLRRNNMIATVGDGIFVQDGKAWEHSRALLRPNFVRDQVSDLGLEERHVQTLLKVLKPKHDGWTAVADIQTLFFRFTIDSATEFLFGESVESQLAEADDLSLRPQGAAVISYEKSFSANFDSAQQHLASRFRLGDMYWLHNPKAFKENNRIINNFIKRYVDIALKKRSNEKHGDEKHYVFVEAIAEQTQDPEEIRGQLLNILLAGRDTTASLLAWVFHELLRNPDVFEKLRSTIIEQFGVFEDPRDISFASLKGCQYLQNCLSETLRVWTTVSFSCVR